MSSACVIKLMTVSRKKKFANYQFIVIHAEIFYYFEIMQQQNKIQSKERIFVKPNWHTYDGHKIRFEQFYAPKELTF